MKRKLIITQLALCLCIFGQNLFAQTTEFTYQGSLKNSGVPTSGNFDFEFKLFDMVSAGAQQGSTIQRLNVAVANGIFTVALDFGTGTLPGADRFLDIAVRTAGGGPFTALTPRQRVNSAPYSVKSLNSTNADTATNATQLGGVAASQYVQTNDTRLSDERSPLAGSANYVQNTSTQQATSNFNISGTGTANILAAATQFNLAGGRILFAPPGTGNSFLGVNSGISNTTGTLNSFFGGSSGLSNSIGNSNSFFGQTAGEANSNGSSNSFFGYRAGVSNTIGDSNSFFGRASGDTNITGIENTAIGFLADFSFNSLTNATAIGARAVAGTSNALVLGSVNGVNGATANTSVGIGTTTPTHRLHVEGTGLFTGRLTVNTQVGIGTTAPEKTLHVVGAGAQEIMIESSDAAGRKWTIQSSGDAGSGRFEIVDRTAVANRLTILDDGSVGIGTTAPTDRLHVNGTLRVNTLGAAGATALCRNASNQISNCSSSLRYKTNFAGFFSGLAFVNKLRPISFDWKDGGMKDVGFGAEDIEKIDPRFVTYNDQGEVEGVKYDRLSVAFVNAFKEQQTQIAEQQKQIDELKMIVCSLKPEAAVCNRTGK